MLIQSHTPSVMLPDGTRRAYPQAVRTSKIDDVNGVPVADPYRALEVLDSPETQAFVSAENELTRTYLDQVPERAQFKQALQNVQSRLRRLDDVIGDRIYYTQGVGKQQPLICEASVGGRQERVLFDPNVLSQDGSVAVDEWKVSPDRTKLVYGLRRNGTDHMEWHVRDIDAGQDLPEALPNGRYGAEGITWAPDSKGFFYERYKQPEAGKELTEVTAYDNSYYHVLGTPQSEDKVVEDTEGLPVVTNLSREVDGNYWSHVSSDQDHDYFLAKGPGFPRGALIAWDDREEDQQVLLIPEGKQVLEKVCIAHGQIFAQTLTDAHSHISRYDDKGNKLGEIDLPAMGTVSGLEEAPQGRLIYSFSSPTRPTTIYSYDVASNTSTALWKPEVNWDTEAYVTEQRFFPSKDGTQIPVYLTHRQDVPLDGQRPTYLYAYGGFDVDETPHFDWTKQPWLDKGGVYAEASLRGGGEYGEDWHKRGMRTKKQNVFDDFIAVGEGLIKSGVTKPEHLAIGGGSNGGLLVAATTLQRPDLFGAAIPEVGVHDMVRFPLFTGGHHWIQEYGEVDKPTMLAKMLAYSPVHNVVEGRSYPPTMVMTGDHDDRVVPSHSYKLAAELQQAQGGEAPILLRTEHNIGHGFGAPLSMTIEGNADRFAFLWNHIGPRQHEEAKSA